MASASALQLAVRPLVICGPSGVGKGTLLARAMKEFEGRLRKCVTHTTRDRRMGEENGRHYWFTDRSAMEAQIKHGEFIEHAIVHGNLYGTSFAAVEAVAKTGDVCVFEVDIQGCETLRPLNPFYIFVSPPSFADLKERLTIRGSETASTLATRLATAQRELEAMKKFTPVHCHIINSDFETAYQAFRANLQQLYPSLNKATL